MTYRDPAPSIPDCPVCDSAEQVHRHENEHQGRFLCMGCMLLFDGTSAEWLRPKLERPAASDEIEEARAALQEARDR